MHPNFVERSTLKLPLSKLCAVLFALQNRALFEGKRRAKWCREKGKKGAASKGGKKEKRTRENRSGPFRPVSVPFVPFRAASGESWGGGWGRGGVGVG